MKQPAMKGVKSFTFGRLRRRLKTGRLNVEVDVDKLQDYTHWKIIRNHKHGKLAPPHFLKEPWRHKHIWKSIGKSNWESLTPRLSGWQKKKHIHPPNRRETTHEFPSHIDSQIPSPSQVNHLKRCATSPSSLPPEFRGVSRDGYSPGFPDWHLHNQSSQCLVPYCRFASRWPGNQFLVRGWTNPFEKYARQNGFIFPK